MGLPWQYLLTSTERIEYRRKITSVIVATMHLLFFKICTLCFLHAGSVALSTMVQSEALPRKGNKYEFKKCIIFS